MVKIAPDGDVLYGASAIADFLGVSPNTIYYRVQSGSLPTFRLGSSICARRSTLRAWMEEQEAVAGGQYIGLSRGGMLEPRG
ncbi:helix-turn-helix domain-containing protein [Ancylobacter sonchi]|uniref:helix-turn-helix transcriptional regulator n=1 Tax=Ancylobacter sonchi TaxID=1937790 RepID=UPI001BD42784|nr:helix-turn-helix domain-containing protein [Ancylobacter sonchi]MBS7534999.1 helix-turn-helix domain-containing protein [Ancylobacter sonchi]